MSVAHGAASWVDGLQKMNRAREAGDISSGEPIMPPALRAQLFLGSVNPRLAPWATDIPRASRARTASLLKTAKAQDYIQHISEYADLSS